MNNFFFLFLLVFFFTKPINAQKTIPVRDLVPDKETAIKIAKAIWYPIYGNKIDKYDQFIVELSPQNIWMVAGALPKKRPGGAAIIYIRKRDCKIIDVFHTK